jgi:hypothetical protein
MRHHNFISSCILGLCVSIGLSVAWPAQSWATTLYTFTFDETSSGIGVPVVTGSFSIPVSDFTGAVSSTEFSVPSDDISAIALTVDSQFLGLSERVDGSTVNFNMDGSDVPQVYYETGAYPYITAATPDGCATTNSCQYGAGPGNTGLVLVITPAGLTEVFGNWVTTTSVSATPLPSTWTMLLIGLAGLGIIAYRRQRESAALTAA